LPYLHFAVFVVLIASEVTTPIVRLRLQNFTVTVADGDKILSSTAIQPGINYVAFSNDSKSLCATAELFCATYLLRVSRVAEVSHSAALIDRLQRLLPPLRLCTRFLASATSVMLSISEHGVGPQRVQQQ